MANHFGFFVTPYGTLLGSTAATPVTGLCKMYVVFKDMQGRPIPGQRVFFYEPANTNVEGPSVELVSDENGRAEGLFERGKEVEVAFIGTAFNRRIVIPDAPSADILQVANIPVFDAFAIVKADPIPAIRRSIP